MLLVVIKPIFDESPINICDKMNLKHKFQTTTINDFSNFFFEVTQTRDHFSKKNLKGI